MKNKTLKKISLFLAALLLALTASQTAFDGAFACLVSASPGGKCGDGLTWTIDGSGTLTVSGTGEMYDYEDGSYAPWYSDRANIKKVVIGSGVTSIGRGAFIECDKMISATLGSDVTAINYCAFYYCTGLVSINIPGKVKTIGISAFEECRSLSEISIPDSVTEIGEYAFENCGSITKYSVGVNNEKYLSDEYGVLFDKDKIGLIKYPAGNTRTSYTIPNNVRFILKTAFQGSKNLKSVTIGSKVKLIGSSAFAGCSGLTSVKIPDSVTEIESFAFENCSKLKSVTIPDSVTSVSYQVFNGTALYENDSNWQDDVLYVGNHLIEARYGKTGSYHIKEGTVTVAVSAFFDCEDLTGVKVPNSVKAIGELAFYGCSSLESVTLGNGITSIGRSTFRGCFKLKSIAIPASVTEIGEGAFEECVGLSTVLMPDGIKTIGSYAFADCFGIKSIKIPESVTAIGEYAFYGCAFASVTIPAGVKTIGACAFGYYGEYDLNSDILIDTKIDGFRIYCYPISAGENYAKDNGFNYTLIIPRPTVSKGDVDGNGKIDSTDFIWIKRHILKISLLSGNSLSSADTDGNGIVDSTDYLLVKRCILGLGRLL